MDIFDKMKLTTIAILSLLLFIGCYSDPDYDEYKIVKQNTEGAVHLYLNPKDTGGSLKLSIQKDSTKATDSFHNDDLYIKYSMLHRTNIQGHVIFIDQYNGISVYKRKNGSKGIYLKIIGAYAADSIAPTILKVKTAIGIAYLNFSNPSNPITESFNFNYPGYGPPIDFNIVYYLIRGKFCTGSCSWRYYFQCPTASDKIIYGWKVGTLNTDPICYQYSK